VVLVEHRDVVAERGEIARDPLKLYPRMMHPHRHPELPATALGEQQGRSAFLATLGWFHEQIANP
jgi:hypothetical protein